MPSKRSFFNRALFRKNLGRFWPLWGCVSLAGALVPLYILLGLLSGQMGGSISADEFAYSLYQAVTIFAPGFLSGYAILCAMAVWGYLYNSRSVGLMHTLPVDRTCLFVTNTLSGLAMVLIPFAVVGLLVCLIALFWGFMDLGAVLLSVLAVLLLAALFFGLASACAMLTGHIFVLPVFYLLFNFLATLLEALISSLAETFLIGVGFDGPGRFAFLSPLIQIYSKFKVYDDRAWDQGFYLAGLGTVALYGLVGLALLALAWALYRRRQSESAGDVVASRWLRPVFRYGVALLSGLILGRLVYELLWGLLFQRGRYADLVPMCLCMAAMGVVGYYAASMLLEKSLRVFRHSWPGVATVCAGAVILCTLTSLDIFGAERWVPEADDVAQIHLGDYNVSLDFSTAEPEMINQILGIHQAIVADRDYIRADPRTDYRHGVAASRYLHLTYQLKDGRTVRRLYDLRVTAERAADPETYDGRLLALYSDPAVIRQRVALPKGAEITAGFVYGYGRTDDSSLDAEMGQRLYDAMLQDAAAGNIPGYDLLNGGVPSYDLSIELEYSLWGEDGANAYSHRFTHMELYPTMSFTLQALKDMDRLTGEELAEMDEALRDAYGDWTQAG